MWRGSSFPVPFRPLQEILAIFVTTRRASILGADSDKIALGLGGRCEVLAMRVIMLAVLAAAAFWAFDAYKYDGRYSRELWQQAATDDQYFSDQVRRQINGTLSGH
jgi:hypothetical protein